MSAQVVKERKQWWYGGVAKKCNFASSSGIWMAAVLVERRALMEKKRADAHHANYSITILTDGSSSASGTANEENLQGEKTAFACQGTRLHLKCLNQSEVIKVTRANYGRFSIAVCNDKSMTTWSVNCFSSKAKEVFANKSVPQKYTFFLFSKGLLLSLCSCNNFAECHILAEDFDFGPNPCPDTERYLEASYVCVPRSQNYHEGKTIKKVSFALFFVADAVARKRKGFSFV